MFVCGVATHQTVALTQMVQVGVNLHITIRMLEHGPELVGELRIGVSRIRVRPQDRGSPLCCLTGEKGDKKYNEASVRGVALRLEHRTSRLHTIPLLRERHFGGSTGR